MRCTVVLGLACDLSKIKGDVIGADKGAYQCAASGIKMIAAFGDFDSVSDEQKKLIEAYSLRTVTFNPIKDNTDCEAAIAWALESGYEDILVLGGLGGRQDHNFANLRLLKNTRAKIVFQDDKNKVFCLDPGTVEIEKEGYKYLSLFALTESRVTLQHVAYPLYKRVILPSDIYTVSNEINAQSAVLTIDYGRVLVMQCSD